MHGETCIDAEIRHTREEIEDAAYIMEQVYKEAKTWYDAIHDKRFEPFKYIGLVELECMWKAIDAWNDLN